MGHFYSFSNTTTNFSQAIIHCQQSGGTLARFLDKNIYERLNSCFRTLRRHFWIGLAVERKCEDSPIGPYKWVGDANCTSGNLEESFSDLNNGDCLAVTIQLIKNRARASIDECAGTNHFICQSPIQTFTTPDAPTTKNATSFTTSESENISKATAFADTTSPNSISTATNRSIPTTKPNDFFNPANATENITTDGRSTTATILSPNNPFFVFLGISAGSVILICLISLLIYRFSKAFQAKKSKKARKEATDRVDSIVHYRSKKTSTQGYYKYVFYCTPYALRFITDI